MREGYSSDSGERKIVLCGGEQGGLPGLHVAGPVDLALNYAYPILEF